MTTILRLRAGNVRRDYWLLMLLALVVLGAGLGGREPWPADEPRFALVAKQMWESGQWLIPYRGDHPYPDKPPLFMWLQVLCYSLIGSWRIAFLLPSLLAGLGTLALVYDLGRRLWSRRAAWWGTALLLFSLHFCYQFKRAQIDPTLVFFVTLSVYGLLRHLLKGPSWGWYLVGGLAAGLGVISKGVGAIALLMLLPYLWARWRAWSGLALPAVGGWRWLLIVPALLLPIGLWLLPMLQATYGSGNPQLVAYADNILFGQTVKRFANPWHHLKPPWYFLQVLLTWLPLNLLWPWALPAWWRRLKRGDARVLLPLAFVVLVIGVFSLSAGKRDVYILPALPMLALASMPLLNGLLRRRGPNWLAFGFATLLSSALLLGGMSALLGEPGFESKQEALRWLDPASDQIWWLLSVTGVLGLLAALWARPRRGMLGLAGALTALWVLVFGWWGYALLNPVQSGSRVMQQARLLAGPERTLGLVGWKEQMLLQASEPVVPLSFLSINAKTLAPALQWLQADPPGRVLFLPQELLEACFDASKAQLLGPTSRRVWYLADSNAIRSDCPQLAETVSPTVTVQPEH